MEKLILSIGCFLVLLSCSSKKDAKKGDKAASSDRNRTLKVQAFVVNPTTISEKIEVPGSLLPFESTELHPETSGRVVGLYIKEGGYVKKGALLAKLFDGDLQAQIKKSTAQLRIAETTADRYRQLLNIGGVSQQEYDLSKLEISNIQADIAVLRTQIVQTEIRAPYSGRIGLRSISQGAYVTPATIVATIHQVDKLKLEFTIPEIYSSKIKTGDLVSFKVEGNELSYRSFAARVMATEASVTANNRSLMVRGVVNGKTAGLLPGTFAKVTVDLGEDGDALLVPSQAIIPQARGKQIIVYKGGTAKFINVNTNVRDSAMVQVTSGLQPGDTVVTTGLMAVKPSTKIELVKITNANSKDIKSKQLK